MVLPLHRIRERRKSLGLSQDDLAEMAGTNQGQVSRYENGEAIPMADVLRALAKSLGCSADWLLGMTDHINPFAVSEGDLNTLEREALNAIRATIPGKRKQVVDILKRIVEVSL